MKCFNSFFLGFVASTHPKIKLQSMSPLGGSFLWENFFGCCPVLSFLRFVFNPILTGGGSAEIQYVNNPKFVFCVMLEHINYLFLKPINLFQKSWNVCTR